MAAGEMQQNGCAGSWRQGRWVVPAFEALLGIVALIALLTAIFTGLTAFLDDEIETSVRVDSEAPATEVAGYRLEPERATLTIEEPDLADRFAFAVPPILGALVVGIVTALVLEVVRSLREGDPFTRTNACILSHASIVAVVGGVVVAVAEVAADSYVRSDLPDALPVIFSAQQSWISMFAGLLLAALAQVFHRGTSLREDLEGVV
jgi:hypothetical protein